MGIQEGNELIGVFMGLTPYSTEYIDKDRGFYMKPMGQGVSGVVAGLNYNSSWGWIMPVVEKIEGMGYQFKICRKRVEIFHDGGLFADPVMYSKRENKLESVYNACIDFIKLYNKQQKNGK